MKINLIPSVTKTQCFTHLSFNSLFQSISDTSSDLQKILRYLNDTEIVAFSEISFAAAAFLINLVLWLKDYLFVAGDPIKSLLSSCLSISLAFFSGMTH